MTTKSAPRLLLAVLLLLLLAISVFAPVSAQAASAIDYPVLPTAGVQYYETTFPVSLVYSDGWYGTFTNAPQQGLNVLLFDDNKGICVFSLPIGIVPSGEQGGTTLRAITQKDADKILKGYDLATTFTPFDADIAQVLDHEDKYTGAWAGEKLRQKWEATGNLSPPVSLTPKQQTFKDTMEAEREARNNKDLLFYDPPRYWVAGQVFITNGAVITSDITGRVATSGNTTLTLSTTGGGGTFTITMANATAATVTSGSAAITGSPVTLAAGANILTSDGAGTCALNITSQAGTADWLSTNTWSSGSGGAAGASVPTSADTASMNANSAAAAGETLADSTGTGQSGTVDWTGITNNPTWSLGNGNQHYFYGDLVLAAGVTVSWGATNCWTRGNPSNLWLAGKSIGTLIVHNGTLAKKTVLQDSGATINNLYTVTGTLDTNGQTVTITTCTIDNATGGLTLGASTLTTAGFSVAAASTLTANTSTIKVTGTGAFAGGGKTYNAVELNGSAHTVSGSNTFTSLTLPSGTTQTITLTAGTTQTITTATLSGSSGHVHTIISSSAGNAATLTKAGGGKVFADWLSLKDNTGSPATTWFYGPNSSVVSGVTGWTSATTATITLSAATLIIGATARLNGNITAVTGDNATVTVYWGTTDHPGTSVGWDSNAAPTSPAQPQGVAALYKDIGSLSAGTTYYFTASAANVAGTTWPTASLSFVSFFGPPTVFTATVNGNNIDLVWSGGVTNTIVVRGTTRYPTSVADGTTVYSGTATSFSDAGLDIDGTQYYYSAWGLILPSTYSSAYISTTSGGTMIFLGILALLALILTAVLFITRESMLGFPAALFWAVFGAYCYTLSTTPWGDIYYYLFFASAFGMTIFTAFAAYALREKRDSYGDQEMDEGGPTNGTDEGDGAKPESSAEQEDSFGEDTHPSRRTLRLRARADRRRSGNKTRYGEFK